MTIHLLYISNMPIMQQLQLEEALLRIDTRNFCIINVGSPRAVVMGISGKPDELVDRNEMASQNVPLIKRYSGGGTVVVDEKTVFVTWIMGGDVLGIKPYPEPVLQWSTEFYKKAFEIEGFGLIENDYVIGEKKCGGNAQYFRKNRWVHHTTFLWDYSDKNMELLLMPKRKPEYRKERSHLDFLVKLLPYFSSANEMGDAIAAEVRKQFSVEDVGEEIFNESFGDHRKAVEKILLEGF
ncbi:MAG: lipoate--protein ligase family protein [Simkaniaceae bacterium]|nr:lipoate--protein ligase family protein [Simkaniaceae bacterium]